MVSGRRSTNIALLRPHIIDTLGRKGTVTRHSTLNKNEIILFGSLLKRIRLSGVKVTPGIYFRLRDRIQEASNDERSNEEAHPGSAAAQQAPYGADAVGSGVQGTARIRA